MSRLQFHPRKKGPGRRSYRNKAECQPFLTMLLKGEIVATPGAKLAKKALRHQIGKKHV